MIVCSHAPRILIHAKTLPHLNQFSAIITELAEDSTRRGILSTADNRYSRDHNKGFPQKGLIVVLVELVFCGTR